MKKDKGFTLLVAVVVTSLLLIVSFAIGNTALRQLVISYANKESQYAFYNADGGTECAVYWDLKGATPSSFDPSSTNTISCGGSSITVTRTAIVNNYATSSFRVNFIKGCADVDVVKNTLTGTTKVDSYGYNSCSGTTRRFQRGVTLTYD